MSKVTPIFFGIVSEEGRLRLYETDKWKKYLLSLKEKEVGLELRARSDQRSSPQNRYYWGVVVRMISDEMGELVPEDTHVFLKSLFLKKGVDIKGKRFEVIGSTTGLSTIEFEEYLEKCRQFAANELDCVIPMPNEISLEI